MAVPIGEAHDLVFDARAVARAARFDLAGVHRGAVEIGPDQGMDLGGGARDPAMKLRLLDRVRQERKGLWIGIPRLDLQLRKIDRAGREPAGGAGLEAVDPDAEALECPAHACRGSLPCPAAGRLRLAGMHHRRGPILCLPAHSHTNHPGRVGVGARSLLQQQFLHQLLPQVEVGGLLDDAFHLHLIEPLVGLGPGAVHRRPLRAVEHPKLEAGSVDGPCHHPAEGIDLPHQLRLADAADRRIAAHLPDGVAIGGQQGCLRAEPGRGTGRLHASMAGTDDDHVVVVAAGHREVAGGTRNQIIPTILPFPCRLQPAAFRPRQPASGGGA